MTADRLDLDALEVLEAAATGGPWQMTSQGGIEAAHYRGPGEVFDSVASVREGRDWEFVVALRNAAPALIAAARERDGAVQALSDHRCDEQAERAYARAVRAEADLRAAQAALARVRTWAEARLLPERRSDMEQAQHAFAQHVLNVATEGQEAGD